MPSPEISLTTRRLQMVEHQLRARGIRDERVLQAMARVPRHHFLAEALWNQAYEDHPLPLAEEQTISQPYIVAMMLQALALSASDRVLEIGTGSGYQTALLAELSAFVYSMERHPRLAHDAEEKLAQLNYTNVKVFVGDGNRGLPEYAPFDAIIVSAAAPRVPPALFAQMREAGRMVIPIGPPEIQELQLITKQEAGPVIRVLEGCRFVPLISSN